MRRAVPFYSVLCACSIGGLSPAIGQVPPPANKIELPVARTEPLPIPEGVPEELRQLVLELAEEGVSVDFERRVIEVKGVTLLDHMNSGYPIEYLMVTNGGSAHEALCMVRCTPSKLNAAFLALGLTPGRTVQFVKKDPPPPLEKLISGEEAEYDAIPPEGAVVDIGMRWTTADGTERMHSIEDLIVYLTNDEPLPRRGFVYVGSRFARVVIGTERVERYAADLEGNIVSLYLAGSGSCLFDMNSVEGAQSYLYDINTSIAPPAGTVVHFVFALR